MLVGGRASDPIPGKDLREILNGLAAKPNGSDVALEILYMRLFSDRNQKKPAVPEVVETGRDLLQKIKFKKDGQRQDHRLARIIKSCLTGDGAGNAFAAVCENFKKSIADNTSYAFHYDDFVQSLFTARPVDALEIFLGGDEANRKLGIEIIRDTMRHGKPIQFVTPMTLSGGAGRAPTSATCWSLTLFRHSKQRRINPLLNGIRPRLR